MVLTSLPWIRQQANEEPGQTTGLLGASLPELSQSSPRADYTTAYFPFRRGVPFPPSSSFCPRDPRNSSSSLAKDPVKLPGQEAPTAVSWLPSSLDPPSLDLGTSLHSWFQRKRELLPLCFSVAPPSSPPNEIRQAARITKQHSGQRQFDFQRSKRCARPERRRARFLGRDPALPRVGDRYRAGLSLTFPRHGGNVCVSPFPAASQRTAA